MQIVSNCIICQIPFSKEKILSICPLLGLPRVLKLNTIHPASLIRAEYFMDSLQCEDN